MRSSTLPETFRKLFNLAQPHANDPSEVWDCWNALGEMLPYGLDWRPEDLGFLQASMSFAPTPTQLPSSFGRRETYRIEPIRMSALTQGSSMGRYLILSQDLADSSGNRSLLDGLVAGFLASSPKVLVGNSSNVAIIRIDLVQACAHYLRGGLSLVSLREIAEDSDPGDPYLFPCVWGVVVDLTPLDKIEWLPLLFKWLVPENYYRNRLYRTGAFFLFVSDLLNRITDSLPLLRAVGWDDFRSGALSNMDRIIRAARDMGDCDPDLHRLDRSYKGLMAALRSGDPNRQVSYIRSLGFNPFSRDHAEEWGRTYDLDPVVVDHLSGV